MPEEKRTNDRYFYLMLKENFYDSDDIVLLESMENGYLYSNILLKLYLKSLKDKGKLMYKNRIPYSVEMLAKLTRHNPDIVRRAIEIFQQMDIIEVLDNGAIFMMDIENYIGKSSTTADRQRAYDRRIAEEKRLLLEDDKKSCKKSCKKSYAHININTNINTNTNIEPDIENNIIISERNDSVSKSQLETEFEEVWKEYPKKQGKANALKAYLKARKRGIDKQTILDGIFAYQDYIKAEKTDIQYVKQGSTWFNQECWNDEYIIRRQTTTSDLDVDMSIFRR